MLRAGIITTDTVMVTTTVMVMDTAMDTATITIMRLHTTASMLNRTNISR